MHQKVLITQTKIKQAISLLLIEEQIDTISITDIVNTAQINRSTFYKYFHSKADVITYYEDLILTNIANCFTQFSKQSDSKTLYKAIHQVINYVYMEFDLCKALLSPNNTSNFEERIYLLLKEIIETHILLLSTHNKLNEQIPNEYACDIIICPLISVIKHWLFKEDPEDPDLIFDIIMKMRFLSPYDILNIPYH